MSNYIARKVWIREHGNGPWSCGSCGEPVLKIGRQKGDGNVHHKDGNIDNDTPKNLEIRHSYCHRSGHFKGQKQSEEWVQKRVDAARGKPLTAEHKESVRRGILARYAADPELKIRLGEANRRRFEDPKERDRIRQTLIIYNERKRQKP
jgi:hypothetical protein